MKIKQAKIMFVREQCQLQVILPKKGSHFEKKKIKKL
jgi:hypothetical protein